MIRKFLFAMLALTVVVQADYIMKYQMDSEVQTFMYHNQTSMKLTMRGEDRSEIYRIGKKTYIVSYERGKQSVVDVDEMLKLSRSMGYDASQLNREPKPKYRFKKTGKKIKVAGIKGVEWQVSGVEDGKKFTTKIVATNDKRVLKTTRAMFKLFTAMAPLGDDNNFFEMKKGWVTIKADGMKLSSFKSKKVKKSEYQLPKGSKKQKMPKALAGRDSLVDSCYTKVCCGKTAGEAKVLSKILKSKNRGYILAGTGVCNLMGISSIFGNSDNEGALYKKRESNIQVSLNMNDREGGVLRGLKKSLDRGQPTGAVSGMKYYSVTAKSGIKIVSATLLPMNQQRVEYIIDSKTTLSFTRIEKSSKMIKLDLNIKALKKALKTRTRSTKSAPKSNATSQDVDLNKAADMLKNFF